MRENEPVGLVIPDDVGEKLLPPDDSHYGGTQVSVGELVLRVGSRPIVTTLRDAMSAFPSDQRNVVLLDEYDLWRVDFSLIVRDEKAKRLASARLELEIVEPADATIVDVLPRTELVVAAQGKLALAARTTFYANASGHAAGDAGTFVDAESVNGKASLDMAGALSWETSYSVLTPTIVADGARDDQATWTLFSAGAGR